MLIISKGRASTLGKYDTKKLTPVERLESLYERNYKETGDRETDKKTKEECEKIYIEVKNEVK